MGRFLRAFIVAGVGMAGAIAPAAALAGSQHVVAHVARDNLCINDASSAPAAPSKPGDQFVVRSSKAQEADAVAVAGALRSLKVFQTYEHGLGLTSLLQPGQPGPFPIFLSTGKLTSDGSFDGLFAPLCDHSTWGSLIVDGTIASDPAYMDAVVVHELFHAAQFALLGELTTGSNWWFEATATAAEFWFGLSPDEGVTDVTDHPELPMDAFVGRHQYAAYVFVQWLLRNDKMPTKTNWAFLKESILKVRALGPTAGVDAALKTISQSLGDEVASFWADHTDQLPMFGPRGKINNAPVAQTYQQFTANPAKPLAARLAALVPAPGVQQVELRIDNLPGDVQFWVRLEENSVKNKKFDEAPAAPVSSTPFTVETHPGGNFDELFCRSGYVNPAWGIYPLPKTGDIRTALTTTGKTTPGSFTYDVLTSTKPCPKPIVIVPGFEVGPLHLGMTEAEANKAAKLVVTNQYNYDGVQVDISAYDVSPGHQAVAWFLNGTAQALGVGVDPDFITTTGVRIGSTREEFQQSAGGGAPCVPFGKNPNNNLLCDYQSPQTRYTFAAVHNDDADVCASPTAPCPTGHGWRVGILGVATQTAKDYLPLLLSFSA